MNEIFYGRPDGLGNRVEELIRLSSFAVENNLKIKYYWNNSSNLKYPYRFVTKNIEVEEISNLTKWPTKNFESSNLWRKYISQYNYVYKNQINFNFNLPSLEDEYIGVHIRGTDRLISTHRVDGLKYDGFADSQILESCIEKTVDYLGSSSNNKPLAIFGDDILYVNKIKERLKDYEQLKISYEGNIENEYIDFYHLTNSNKVIMSSIFSTFAITSAILGKIPLVTFFDDRQTTLHKFSANLIKYNIPELPIKNVSLSKDFKPFKNDSLCKLGTQDEFEFVTNLTAVKNTDILISDESSANYDFEENFILIDEKSKVQFRKKKIITIAIKKVYEVIRNNKNRLIILKKLFVETFKTFKIFKFRVIHFPNFKIINQHQSRNKYFIFTENLDINLMKYQKYNNLNGIIIKFEKQDLSKFLIKNFQKVNNLKLIHIRVDYFESDFCSGYLSFINESFYINKRYQDKNFFENSPNSVSIKFI